MASTFAIQARHHWRFQLVLLGGRTQLEGWCDPIEPPCGGSIEPMLRCSAWLDPLQDPQAVAHALMNQPSCALDLSAA